MAGQAGSKTSETHLFLSDLYTKDSAHTNIRTYAHTCMHTDTHTGWLKNLRGTVFFVGPLYQQLAWLLGVSVIYALLCGPAPPVIDTMGVGAEAAAAASK